MSSIFKSNIGHALNQNSSDSSQGIFGGDYNVNRNLEENKKMSTLLNFASNQEILEGRQQAWHKGSQEGCSWGVQGQGQEKP